MKEIPIITSKNSLKQGQVVFSFKASDDVLKKMLGVCTFSDAFDSVYDALGGLFITSSLEELQERFGDEFQVFNGGLKRLSVKVDDIANRPSKFFNTKITFLDNKIYELRQKEELTDNNFIIKNDEYYVDASENYKYDENDRCVYFVDLKLDIISSVQYLKIGDTTEEQYLNTSLLPKTEEKRRFRFVIGKDGRQMSCSVWNGEKKYYLSLCLTLCLSNTGLSFFLGISKLSIEDITIILPKS